MSVLVNINGELVPAEGPVIGLDNRAFHFGDGLFETIRVIDGKPVFLDAHWARLVSGAEVLRITMPPTLDQEKLNAMIVDLMQRAGLTGMREAISDTARYGDVALDPSIALIRAASRPSTWPRPPSCSRASRRRR